MKKNEPSDRRARFEIEEKEIADLFKRKMAALYELFPEFAPEKIENGEGITSSVNFANVVRSELKDRPSEIFTAREVTAWIGRKNPMLTNSREKRVAISNTLSRLAYKGEIVRTTEPGVRPAAYKVKPVTVMLKRDKPQTKDPLKAELDRLGVTENGQEVPF